MDDPPQALFEGAFTHGDVFVRPDVLVQVGSGVWDLYEVKSSTRVKPENITDVAIQLWVLEGCGLTIRRVHLMHIDNTYVYPGGDYDLCALFAAEDVTAEARTWQAELPLLVRRQLEMLGGPEPQLRIGKHCDSPYACGFYGYCHGALPERPVTQLPRVSHTLLEALLDAGHWSIDDIPPLFPGLTAQQRAVIEAVRTGVPSFEPGLARALASLEQPVHFLDFETMQPALPLYPGTRPWQQVPFQWSDHVLAADGTLEHREFLYEGGGDPRPEFARTLLAALGEQGSVVVYSPFENRILRELAQVLPEHAGTVARIQRRLFDLEKPVRAYVRHPELLGKTSIKAVVPALCETVSYEGLGIHEGGTASLRYLECARGAIAGEEREQVYRDLRAYCGTDTMAMVELYAKLRAAVAA
jgi:hypothetical protein